MKIHSFHILPVFFSAAVLVSSFTFSLETRAQTDSTFDKARAECSKNSSREWSERMNRCVEKVESKTDRHEAIDCTKLETLEEQKNCQLKLATEKAGVTGDVNEATSKVTNLQSRSTLINTAYAVISIINLFGKGQVNNTCTSKKILGVTSMAGSLADIMIRIKTQKKLKNFQDRYQLDLKDNAYNAQTKALEYLKEEQALVKEIASLEKKKHMLLLLGYGAATVSAGLETFHNPSCWKPEVKPEPAVTPPAVAKTTPPVDVKNDTVELGTVEEQYEIKAVPLPEGASNTPANIGDTSKEIIYNAPKEFPGSAGLSKTAATIPDPVTDLSGTTRVLVAEKKGNYTYNWIEERKTDTSGAIVSRNVAGVVYNGKFYPDTKVVKGIPMAIGKPQGNFNFTTGSHGTSVSTNILAEIKSGTQNPSTHTEISNFNYKKSGKK